MKQVTKKPILYLIPCNHFDLSWRRPFRTNMEYEGKTFIPYSKIEQYYIEDNIALCKKYPEYKFTVESVAVVREFLKNRPDMKDEFFSMVRDGRIFVTGSGDAIIDTNLVLGETIVRNFVMGLLWNEKNLGIKNRQAFRADAFGNSAQLPQIFRGCELEHAFMLNYFEPDGDYWRGIDGSVIACGYFKNSGNGGNPYKLTPCKECNGTGSTHNRTCSVCNGRGMNSEREKLFFFPFKVKEELLCENGVGYIMLAPEEYLPKAETIERAISFKEKYDVRFVTPEEPLSDLAELFDDLENPPDSKLNSTMELNPANTGCYVTRIKSKQTMRRQEYALLGAETLAVEAWLQGREYPKDTLNSIWHDMFYMAFHDCVTGTVVDAAYKELEEVRKKIDNDILAVRNEALSALVNKEENTVTVINRYGTEIGGRVSVDLPKVTAVRLFDAENGKEITVTDIKAFDDKTVVYFVSDNIEPFGTKRLIWKEEPNDVSVKSVERDYIENSRYKVVADQNGIVSIYDKKQKKEISRRGEYCPGELIFEHDEGSPWATLSDDCKRISLRDRTQLKSIERGNGFERMTFETRQYMGYTQHDVSAVTTVTLTEGIERVDFHSSVNWNSYNHRLRIAFPSVIKGDQIHGIPYGSIKRKNYEPKYDWTGVNGDHPVINWAGIDNGKEAFAVLNRGIPSYKIEEGLDSDTVFITVLRSPTVPTFLHEPNYYSMTEWDGMRDAGRHEFDYSVVGYDSSFAESEVVFEAQRFNAGLIAVNGSVALPEMPKILSDNVYISSLMQSEKGDSLVMRFVEFRGKSGKVQLACPEWCKSAQITNMLERNGANLEIENGMAEFAVRPFEIATVILTKQTGV